MGNCPSDLQKDGDLCYPACPNGYKGVGPVCWAECPPSTTDAGATCTKKTVGRGAGTVPSECADSSDEKDAGLCYTACRNGYKGTGPDCWGICSAGFTDTGVDCLKPKAYGRGAGHITESKCTSSKDHGAGTNGCQKYGALWYPICDSGFHAVGCCICSPTCPTGFTDVGISCQKPSYDRGVGKIPSGCAAGKEKDAGLCYQVCPDGYKGVGPVCWAECTGNTIDAGATCTKKTTTRGAGVPPNFIPAWVKWAAIGGGIFVALIIFAIMGYVVYKMTQ